MAERPFARVYYVDLERDYPDVYHDDHLYATYGRLLAVAEAMWPAIPEIPRSARAGNVNRLVAIGLVIRVAPYGFRVKGMDAERNARSNAASNAARIRWGNAGGHAPTMPSQPSQAKPNQPSQDARVGWSEPTTDVGVALDWLAKGHVMVRPDGRLGVQLENLVERHGSTAVIAAWTSLLAADPKIATAGQFILGASNVLDRIPSGKPAVVESDIDRKTREASERLTALRAARLNGVTA